MKSYLVPILFMLALCCQLNADVFGLGNMRDPKTNEWVQNPSILIDKLGEDPSFQLEPDSNGRAYKVVYGHLLGVIEGEPIEGLSGATNDVMLVQILNHDGERVGKPTQFKISELHPIPHQHALDTIWDFERLYGSIERSFDAEFGSELFYMVLNGILDPSGEMGLNTLKAKITLPDDFTHGWLTHYMYFGNNPNEVDMADMYKLDAANAFDEYLLGNRVLTLIDHLAQDSKYQIYEPGVRTGVLEFVGLLCSFQRIDPARVSDPILVERAKRLKTLGDTTMWLVPGTMYADSHNNLSEHFTYGRPITEQERTNAMLEVIAANLDVFAYSTDNLMAPLLNAGQKGIEHPNYPHPECEEPALSVYFSLLEDPEFTGDPARDSTLREAVAQRRLFARRALMPHDLNDNRSFTARTRAAFNKIGYGSTADVSSIVEALDLAISRDYQGNLLFEEVGFLAPAMAPMNFEPGMGSFESSPVPIIAPGMDPGESLSDEKILAEALWILRDIAFGLPEGSIGRERKAAVVENWRIRQLEDLQKSLEEGIQLPDAPPAELSPKRKQFKRLLSDDWMPNEGSDSGGVEL